MFDINSIINRCKERPETLFLRDPRLPDFDMKIKKDNILQGHIVERQFFDYYNGEFCDAPGYDGIINGKKYEVKSTSYRQKDKNGKEGYLRINSCNKNKRNLFDYMTIIDILNNMHFIIPHDEWYGRAAFCGQKDGEFHWSGTYNKYDRQKISNTKLLLEYQILEYPKQKT